jgi:hypothetical protein
VFLREESSCRIPIVVLGERSAVLHSKWGDIGSLCIASGRPPSTSREVDCHSVEELGFQLLVWRDVTLL